MSGRIVSMTGAVTTITSALPAEGPPYLFAANRLHSLLLVELLYRLAFGLFLADQHSVQMRDFP
jgi:hypothetical protein